RRSPRQSRRATHSRETFSLVRPFFRLFLLLRFRRLRERWRHGRRIIGPEPHQLTQRRNHFLLRVLRRPVGVLIHDRGVAAAVALRLLSQQKRREVVLV